MPKAGPLGPACFSSLPGGRSLIWWFNLTRSPWAWSWKLVLQLSVGSQQLWTCCWSTCRQKKHSRPVTFSQSMADRQQRHVSSPSRYGDAALMHGWFPHQRWLSPVLAWINSAQCGAESSIISFCTNLQKRRNKKHWDKHSRPSHRELHVWLSCSLNHTATQTAWRTQNILFLTAWH